MASQLAAVVEASPVKCPGRVANLVAFLVRRRVAVSVVLFTGLIALDVFVLDNRPRNVLQWTNPLVVTAELLVVAGLLIRTWAAGMLRKKKQLATTGPYAIIRNPLYFGSFLMMIGFCILINDVQSIWVVLGPVAWLYAMAIRDEERVMNAMFPDQWPQYVRAVPRFVPRSIGCWGSEWSLKQWRHNAEYNAWLGVALAMVGIWMWRTSMDPAFSW